MQTIRKEYEIEIGKIRYSFEIEFSYYQGIWALDPTDQEPAKLANWEFYNHVMGFDVEEETEFIVANEKEIQMIKDWVCIEDMFNEAVS